MTRPDTPHYKFLFHIDGWNRIWSQICGFKPVWRMSGCMSDREGEEMLMIASEVLDEDGT